MAVVGSATYALLAWNDAPLGAWHAGYIDLRACLVLVVGSWLGIRLASRWIGKIPDRLHARAYIVLLCIVLLVMLVVWLVLGWSPCVPARCAAGLSGYAPCRQ